MKYFKLNLTLLFLFTIPQSYLLAQKESSLLTTLKEHSDEVHSVCFDPEGKHFISGSKDESIIIWDFNTFRPIKTIQRHYATIYELEYPANGEYFFSGGDKTINVWDKNGNYINSLSGHATAIWSVGISKNAKYLVSGSFDNNFRLWDVEASI